METLIRTITPTILNEKEDLEFIQEVKLAANPVIESAEFAHRVHLWPISKYVKDYMLSSYTPRTWRTHPVHILPHEPHSSSDPWNKAVLDWIFLISSLNFSFWSEKEGRPDRYGVEWQVSWDNEEKKVWTGYWSLVAALNKALQNGIPITDPAFYSSETLCPDSLIESIFAPAPQCAESIPLLTERIAVMREVGFILTNGFGGSYQGLLDEFQRRQNGQGTALDLVKLVVDSFPSFRDEVYLEGRKGERGPVIQDLTMFADYRVPQILHHLRILTYPDSLVKLLREGQSLEPGCREEISLRVASILSVDRVREEIIKMADASGDLKAGSAGEVSSVLIDFFLWDLAKRIEGGDEKIEGIETSDILPAHRTRSIWY
ncbi:hypothetical protein AAF712_003780 [Marasmius tenuissimus]|uniref:Queuosine 5'-phosphate N-glycosylase/hydrolase n=1 Tax=Marasmius tenuissimus TaxID=585030 RepID=A0ABR3A6T3_9AGAR